MNALAEFPRPVASFHIIKIKTDKNVFFCYMKIDISTLKFPKRLKTVLAKLPGLTNIAE